MQEIKTTLAELDALREEATPGEWKTMSLQMVNGNEHNEAEDAMFTITLHNAYPALRSYIDKLEQRISYLETHRQGIGDGDVAHAVRFAEAGRVLAEDMKKMDARCGFPPIYEPREMVAFKNGWNTNNDRWNKQRDAALSAYHSATRDITSKD